MYSNSRKRNKYIFARRKKSYYVVRAVGAAIGVVVLALLIMFIYVNLFGINSKVHLTESHPAAEINSDVMASSFIESIDDGGTVSQDAAVDTSALGKTECTVVISIDDKEKEYFIDVEIQDTTPPVIECGSAVNVLKGSSPDMTAAAKAGDNSGEEIDVRLSGDYSTDEPGSFDLSFAASDSSGNETIQDFTLNVIDISDYSSIPESLKDEDGNVSFVTDKGFEGNIDRNGVTTVDGTVIVNGSIPLQPGYGPGLTADMYNAFTEMRAAAASDGLSIYMLYGYRGYSIQNSRYATMTANFGEDEAKLYCAEAGRSEHQTGLAADINTSNDRANPELAAEFAATDEGKWLNENCYKYGFIIRYPDGKEAETGFAYAPWHVRYVGKELAETLYNGSDWITLEEYYGLPA